MTSSKTSSTDDGDFTRQLFGVVRHAERADAPWSATADYWWQSSEDFVKYPTDPPLSEHGFREAKQMGRKVREWVEASNSHMHNVMSSPSLRCVQTAVSLCKELGPATRLVIDYRLSEEHSLNILGLHMHGDSTRPLEEVQAYCRNEGVFCRNTAIGTSPVRHETSRIARARSEDRFLKYLHWGFKMRQNWILVSHEHCVRATLSMIPSQVRSGDHIAKVDFGGMFLARRQSRDSLVSSSFPSPASDSDSEDESFGLLSASLQRQVTAESQSSMAESISNVSCYGGSSESLARTAFEFRRQASGKSTVSLLSDSENEEETATDDQAKRTLDGWQVLMHNIEFISKATSKSQAALERKLHALAQTGPYSREQLGHLLGDCFSRESLEPSLWKLPDERPEQFGDLLGSCWDDPLSPHDPANCLAMQPSDVQEGIPLRLLRSQTPHSPLRRECEVRQGPLEPPGSPDIEKKKVTLMNIPSGRLLRRRAALGGDSSPSSPSSPDRSPHKGQEHALESEKWQSSTEY